VLESRGQREHPGDELANRRSGIEAIVEHHETSSPARRPRRGDAGWGFVVRS
jgi:hypothetical protein